MDANTVISEFNKVIANVEDPKTITELEIIREYLTNKAFRKNLEDFTARQNGVK